MPHVKVAVTGAAGQISYALLFQIASGQMFGADTTIELHLLELEQALPALTGVVMELEDCAFPLLKTIEMSADLKTSMTDVNWAILVGAVPRKKGMERADLLRLNGTIFTEQGAAINAYAAKDVRVFVVGNPCNTNCLITMCNAPDVPRERFFAMTLLDENRARYQLAVKAKVDITDVTNMAIWGNHSATQYADFYHAKIKGQAVTELIQDTAWLKNTFIATVQQRGGAVIQARGASSAASAAHAITGSIYNLVHNTPANASYSVSIASRGEYGVDAGLIYSYPCRTENGQVIVIPGIVHNAFAQEKLDIGLAELKQEQQAVIALGLI